VFGVRNSKEDCLATSEDDDPIDCLANSYTIPEHIVCEGTA